MAQHSVFNTLGRFLHLKPQKSTLTESDRKFLVQFAEVVKEHQADPNFTTEAAASALGISRMHLNRRVHALTGRPTHKYILERRLEAARDLLPGGLPIGAIARLVGFRSTHHFAQAFRKYFGMVPSAYPAREPLARQPTGRKPPRK